jgi:DNA polymerase III delta subunit
VIHLFHGADDYQVRKAVAAIRDRLASGDDMLATNTTVLDGRGLTPAELLAHATAVPFLSASRLVIVEGLIEALGETKGGRRKKKSDADDPLEPWKAAAGQLSDQASMPETTTLIFVEGALLKTNPAFPIFAPISRTVECAPLEKGKIAGWIKDVAKEKGVKLADGVPERLAVLVGADLWALDRELEKLAAYANGETIDLATLVDLVSDARDTKAWDLTDAVLAGNEKKAVTALQRMLTAGDAPQMLLVMVGRQYRQLALLKDSRERRLPHEEAQRVSGVPPFKLNEVGALADRYRWPALRRAYRHVLEADLSVKRGLQDDESSLQLLVHELCAMAPGRAAPQRPAAR